MPIFIRLIARGVVLFGSALLTFVGISPNISIPTEQEAFEATEERREIIRETIFENAETSKATEPIIIVDSTKLPLSQPEIKTETPSLPHIPVQTPLPTTNATETKITEEEPAPEIITQENTLPSTIKNVVLNIVCTNRESNKISVTTGSGVLISSKGVVITNAHVAQQFLLENYTREGYMDCSLRRENIPTVGYRAKLLYISKDWLSDNAHLIKNPAPRGTGENDYAILAITDSTNPTISLPNQFPTASLDTLDGDIKKGDSISVAGYPGNQTSFFDLTSSARLAIEKTIVADVYTFDRITTDVFSTSETRVAERGSSGGGIFKDNELIGIIATTGGSAGDAFINGITLSYINRDIKQETGEDLNSLISGDVKQKANSFTNTEATKLLKLLEKYL